jgi:hypothetical protein
MCLEECMCVCDDVEHVHDAIEMFQELLDQKDGLLDQAQ